MGRDRRSETKLKLVTGSPATWKINEDETFNEEEESCPFEFGDLDEADEGGVDLDEI